ncbi:MAG TPA: DUF6519 domain-containing protein [Acidisarcina sp.]
MSFDSSRFTFDPWNNFFGVVMQQGRVQLDSDWNEWLAELSRRIQAGNLDTMGRAAVPQTTPSGFQITVPIVGGTPVVNIGVGRMYVDGLLAENHGLPAPGSGGWAPAAGLAPGPGPSLGWDKALAELVGQNPVPYPSQPYFPSAPPFPAAGGPFFVYLDVWQREITFCEDPDLVEKAVGVDTTGRLQTVWQVKWIDLSNAPGVTCSTPDSGIPGWSDLLAPPGPQLTTGVVQSAQSGPCCLAPNTGYTGLENQLYRVEIHQGGAIGTATFKWSRDDASVATPVTAITQSGSTLTVQSVGKDDVLRFSANDWVEITDDWLELSGQPGELHQVKTVTDASSTITLFDNVSTTSFPVDANGLTAPSRHTKLRRWDQGGVILESDGVTVWTDLGAAGATGDIPVPPAGTSLILESGITVSFTEMAGGGTFVPQQFWTFAARTADGTVEYLNEAPPRGIHHHYARLSVVTLDPAGATDCRTPWPPSSAADCDCCCTCTVGDGVNSTGKYTSIQAAIDAVPEAGGEVCILPGLYFENVFISGRRDIVIRGCGSQTRVASAALQPDGSGPLPAPGMGQFNAVFSISTSEHIELCGFAIEAADEEVGILIDGTGKLVTSQIVNEPAPQDAQPAAQGPNVALAGNMNLKDVVLTNPGDVKVVATEGIKPGAIDITIKEMVLTASTLPAILAKHVELLRIDESRIAMEDVRSLWPAVWVSGREIHIDRNWVGVQTALGVEVWIPGTVKSDLRSYRAAVDAAPAGGADASNLRGLHPGGIQIAGSSVDVFVLENEIEGGSRNGITLGSVDVLDGNGDTSGQTVGVIIGTVGTQDPCSDTGTLEIPVTFPGAPGTTGGRVVAGGLLQGIQIDRNRIGDCGLCGIGPVGFFNLLESLEIISIRDLTIAANQIGHTLLKATQSAKEKGSIFGYGAICIPDVENLVIRDNSISDYGAHPGLALCGIFVLNGQMVDISRNQILETRDWTRSSDAPAASDLPRSGIALFIVTPPTPSNPYSSGSGALTGRALGQLIFEPGLPALRVEHNVVRVPLGTAIEAVGFGPFSVVNNHFTSGGTVPAEGLAFAQTVLIMNLGAAIETEGGATAPSGLSWQADGGLAGLNANNLSQSSSGATLFTNNICQSESQFDAQTCLAGVLIISIDHLLFSHNHCWLDGPQGSGITDALLLAGSVQATSNRFQESLGFPVTLSAWTLGAMNITSQNISTYCLFIEGAMKIDNDNLSVIQGLDPEACAVLTKH